jgi:serine protease
MVGTAISPITLSASGGTAPYTWTGTGLPAGLSRGELWSGAMTQYCDGPLVSLGATTCPAGAAHVGYPTGGALAGVWYDNAAAAPRTATDAQLGTEAVKAASHFGNTTAAANRYAQYVVLSPT